MNPRQQITAATYGSSLNASFGYDAYGYPDYTTVGSIMSYDYDFEEDDAWLNSRANNNHSGCNESFEYDNLERLDRVYRGGTTLLDMAYSTNGNITTKSDVGSVQFGYNNSSKPYALTDIEAVNGLISDTLQTVAYTSFEQPSSITENPYQATFTYNSDDQRAKMTVTQGGNTILTRWYAGSRYMKETTGSVTKEYTYLGGDAYTAPVVAVTQGGTTTYYYLLRDHLGSVTHLVNTANTVVAEYSYDAWGRRRVDDDWDNYNVSSEPDLFAGRGFTAHEYLPWFDLYNMNGRLYDPIVGRFLSPDENVQLADFTQGFNRYSYCLNNPLLYSDPDGEFIFTALLPGIGAFIDAACWGAVIGGAGYTASVAFSDGGFKNWDGGAFWKSVGIGAITGAVTAGIGQMYGSVGSNGFTGELARAYTHGFANGMISEFSGGDFMSGFAAGGLSSIAGSSFMMYGGRFANSTLGAYSFSGLAGGAGSELTGGNFWEGAAIGVMNAGLNHIQSMVGEAGARYFANKKAAYDYMWDNSFSDGDPLREVSAWELENGDAIVLPYDENGLHYSKNSALSVSKASSQGVRMIKFNGKAYAISTHAHTHPSIDPSGGIGLSGLSGDAAMYNFLKRPIHVLYNKSLYSATYSSKGRWYWSNQGAW